MIRRRQSLPFFDGFEPPLERKRDRASGRLRSIMENKILRPIGAIHERETSARFDSFVHPCANTGCFLWGGATRNGYGAFWNSDDRLERAHRYAYRRAHGTIPAGKHVLHRCDQPLCVNPDHLFIGTDADNSRDKVAKGRQAKGEKQGSAKLNPDKVRAIRLMREQGATFREIASAFDCASETIRHVCAGRTWSHVRPTGFSAE